MWNYGSNCGILDDMFSNGLGIMEVRIDDRVVELSEEQLDAFEALTKLQRGVALATLAGKSPDEAHRSGGGKCGNEEQRYDLGIQILANPRVKHFLSTMATEPAPEIASAVLSRDELLIGLTTIARTTIDDVVSFTERPSVDMESGLEVFNSSVHVKSIDEIPPGARSAIKSLKQTKNGLEITMYDTLQARKQIAEMCGYNAPTKTELSGPDGKPLQVQEIPDEEIETKLKALGLGRYHNQLGSKRVGE